MDARVLQILSESFTKILIPGILVTIPLTLISFALALVIAVVVAMVQYANVPVLKQISRFYIWLIRGTPLLVQLMVGFYGLKAFGIETTAFVTAVVVFALNEGAYCSETIRGCLESVPKGQMEAGYCVGMSYMQIMWHVVLPQAFRTAFPSLGNSLISMVKDTSLASNITVVEMFMRTRQIIGAVPAHPHPDQRGLCVHCGVSAVRDQHQGTHLLCLHRAGEGHLPEGDR